MTKYLFTTLPSNDLGLLVRSLPIARELSHAGHEVVFFSPGKSPRKVIAEAGFENMLPAHPASIYLAGGYALRHLSDLYAGWKARYGGNRLAFWRKFIGGIPTRFISPTPHFWNMDHAAAAAGMMNENFVRAVCESFMGLIEDCLADVVVNFWNPFAAIAAKALGKPLVAVIQVDEHPAGRGFIWWKDAPDDLPTCVPTVNRVLADFDLHPIDKFEEISLGDLTLVVGIPEIDPLPETADVTYIGPLLWQQQNDHLPAWIDDLNQDRPVIWVYSGNPRYGPGMSAFNSEVVIKASIEALAGKDVQVVLTTGHHALPKRYLPLPDNFRHELYVPGQAMAARSDLLIHHGGYGSCQTGLYAGTPAVIIPTFAERESNARRLAEAGTAELVLPDENHRGKKVVNADELWDKVSCVLTDETYKQNATAISRKLQSYGGASQAAALIQQFWE